MRPHPDKVAWLGGKIDGEVHHKIGHGRASPADPMLWDRDNPN